MDRRSRRFVPSSDGLEERKLLSTASATSVAALAGNPLAHTTPANQQTIEAKRHHIQNLPYFIGLLNKDHVVPQPAVENIQNDLYTFVGKLHPGNSSLVSSFNLELRKALSYENITPISQTNLNRDFGAILVSAGVDPRTAANLQTQLTSLIRYDSTQVGSTIAATNDYATVLQLGLLSGRPLVYPNLPSLLGADHQGNHGKIPITHNHLPSLTGNYTIGTNIQIVDEHNKVVLGQASVDSTTSVYSVRFNNHLPDGTYVVRVRAEDSGLFSDPSPKFTFEVVTSPPKK